MKNNQFPIIKPGEVSFVEKCFSLGKILPINWTIYWHENSNFLGWLGNGVYSTYNQIISFSKKTNMFSLIIDFDTIIDFNDIQIGDSYYSQKHKLTIIRSKNGFVCYNHQQNMFYNFHLFDSAKNVYYLTSIVNLSGITLVLEYNNFKLDSITDIVGRKIFAIYNQQGFIKNLEIETPEGRENLVSFDYDEYNNLISITNALNQSTVLEYFNHLLISKTDKDGNITHWEYDKQNRCIHTYLNKDLNELWFEYNPEKQIVKVKNALDAEYEYFYNNFNLVTRIQDSMCNIYKIDYTDLQQVYRKVDPSGKTIGFCYDDFGNLSEIDYPNMSEERFVYNKFSLLTTHTNQNKESITYKYDENTLLLTSSTDIHGLTTHYKYNSYGLLISKQSEDILTEYIYDDKFNIEKIIQNGEIIKSYKYDYFGRVIQEYIPHQNLKRIEYDKLGRIIKISDYNSNNITLKYNNCGYITEYHDNIRNITINYTPFGKVSSYQEDDKKTIFNYDQIGNLISVINPNNNYYQFTRDLTGKIISEKGFDGIELKYEYNPSGEIVKIIRPDGRFTEIERDLYGNVSSARYYDDTFEEFWYDYSGRITQFRNQFSLNKIEYDKKGNIISETMCQPFGDKPVDIVKFESSYNNFGNKTSFKSSLGSEEFLTYNKSGFLEKISTKINGIEKLSCQIKRDEIGRELERFANNGLKISNIYDDNGNLGHINIENNQDYIASRGFSWIAGGKLKSFGDNQLQPKTIFEYNSLGQLETSFLDSRNITFRSSDISGNYHHTESQDQEVFGKSGQIIHDSKYYYRYDCEGNLIHKSKRNILAPDLKPKDLEWQLGDTYYTWYGNNMLKSVKNPDGYEVVFEYDAIGRRTAKIFNGKVTRYAWNSETLIHEWTLPADLRPQTQTDDMGRVSYNHEEQISDLVTWCYNQQSLTPIEKHTSDKSYSIVSDYQGTPFIALNEENKTVWQILLGIYGEMIIEKGIRNFVPFRFQGQYEDQETGLYYSRNRYYDPQTGVYLSPDSMRLKGKNSTLYSFVDDPNTEFKESAKHSESKDYNLPDSQLLQENETLLLIEQILKH